MSSKKTPAKSAAKPKAKVKSVVKAKAAAKPAPKVAVKAKPKPAAKPVAKAVVKAVAKPAPKTSGFKVAASKLTSALLGRKSAPVPKPVAKAPAKPAPAAKVTAPVKSGKTAKATIAPSVPVRPLVKQPARKINLDVRKGQMTESQIRKMSDKDYMNDAQLSFFYHRLLQMRQEVLDREVEVKERLHEREVFADPADRATAEEEHWLDLRLRERESYLLRKIDEALRRIEADEFGYCEKTGDPIGIPRLLARPTATVCVDVKGQDERVEAQFRDR